MQVDNVSVLLVFAVVPDTVVAVLVLAARVDLAECRQTRLYLVCGHHSLTQKLCRYYFVTYCNSLRPSYLRAHSCQTDSDCREWENVDLRQRSGRSLFWHAVAMGLVMNPTETHPQDYHRVGTESNP